MESVYVTGQETRTSKMKENVERTQIKKMDEKKRNERTEKLI